MNLTKKRQLLKLLKEYKNSQILRQSDGFSYFDMRKWAKQNKNNINNKIVYGIRTKNFYLIDQKDRDWSYASVTPKQYLLFDSQRDAIENLTDSKVVR